MAGVRPSLSIRTKTEMKYSDGPVKTTIIFEDTKYDYKNEQVVKGMWFYRFRLHLVKKRMLRHYDATVAFNKLKDCSHNPSDEEILLYGDEDV